MKKLSTLLLSATAALLVPQYAMPGAFIVAGENNGVDFITHPVNYVGGGAVTVNVCIDDTSPVPTSATSLADVAKSIENAVAIWNQLQPTVGNVLLFSNNDIPNSPVLFDFESVALHEIGHCIGLAHVNAANESGLTEPDRNYTKATDGNIDGNPNGTADFSLNDGVDNVIGSSDDIRGDDVNLHWFRTDSNDPGQLPLPVPVDGSTYDRDQSSLPTGHTFATNLDRGVAGLLGYPNTPFVRQTEAVMQQGTFNDEEQRRLTADGVATVLLAMSGVDEIAGTADDYVINLVSLGVVDVSATPSCDIPLDFASGVGVAFCQTGAVGIGPNHARLSGPIMRFDTGLSWFFNQNGACRQELDLVTGQWKQLALSCAPPAGDDTVADLLEDDLTGTYDVNWVVYEWNAVSNSYTKLGLMSPMTVGRGYWIRTNQASQTIHIEGEFNVANDIALEANDTNAGRYNMLGHPYWYDFDWADVRVVDDASELTLAQADPVTAGNPMGVCQGPDPIGNGCIMSRIAYKYDGSNYASFNGTTVAANGDLNNLDGFWVNAYKSGIKLRIPEVRSTPAAPHARGSVTPKQNNSRQVSAEGWFIRLTAESGQLRDPNNVFGRWNGSLYGPDINDLPELEPFGTPYLTIVFPHPEWGFYAGDYTSDYRANPASMRNEVWEFEVRSSELGAEMTLSWEGDAEIIRGASLFDVENDREVFLQSKGYKFNLAADSHRFRWVQR